MAARQLRPAERPGTFRRVIQHLEPVPGPADEPILLGDTVRQSQVLESLAGAVNYNRWLTSMAVRYLGDAPIELGSGLGNYAQAWLDAGVPRVTVTEIDPSRLAQLRTRFAGHSRVSVDSFNILTEPRGAYSALVAFNVLEHIPDHVRALRGAHTLLRAGGLVVMFVPAFNFAMSRFDRRVGHVRRYTVKSMRAAMEQAGLEVQEVRYVNMPGLPAWFVGMRLLRGSPHEGPLLKAWDTYVIPLARRWESGRRVPFGQSVFAVGRVPGSDTDG